MGSRWVAPSSAICGSVPIRRAPVRRGDDNGVGVFVTPPGAPLCSPIALELEAGAAS